MSPKFSVLTLYILFLTCTLPNLMNAQCESTTVATDNNETTVYTCPGDGISDVITFTHGAVASSSFTYVITDTDNVIIGIPPGNTQDFEGAGFGTCRVWGFSYTGEILAEPGQSVFSTFFSTGCWNITSNAINVIRTGVDGGTVSLNDGTTEQTFCTTDGYDDLFTLAHNNNSNGQYTYLITDDQNNILVQTSAATHNFEGIPVGVCRVWGLSYTGSLTTPAGANAASTSLSDGCFDLSDNYITITRTDVDGGSVATAGGQSVVVTCPGDGNDDIITFSHETNSSANYGYIITDDNNVVLGVPPGNSQNFEGAGPGVCRVWGISFTGNLDVYPGDQVGNETLSSDCYQISSNFIEVRREGLDAGTVAMPSGATRRYTCPGDGQDDIVMFTNTSDATNYQYVITDDNNVILGLPPADSQNFEGAGEGVCRVWGLAYSGTLTAQAGDNAAEVALADGCFDLSDNFITVVRGELHAGEVSTADGENVVYTCPGDGVDDVIEFANTAAGGSNFTYVITDQDLNILGIPAGNSQNFEGAGEGTCLVWGLSYTGTITAVAGDNAGTVELADGCFDLSDNYIEVRRFGPDAGTVAMPSGATMRYTCPGDGLDDIVMFTNTSAAMNYQYVITDENNVILGLPPANSQNFEGAGEGICRVWGLAFTGSITAVAGDNAAEVDLTDGCFDLSDNFITVVRGELNAGGVTTIDGATSVYTCPGDGVDDVIEFANTAAGGSNFTYVITDQDLNILGIPSGNSQNFEGAGEGVCLVWGLSYTGTITAVAGDNAGTVELADGCFDLSDNYIEVTRGELDAGFVTTTTEKIVVYTCPGDGVDDIYEFVNDASSASNYAYVITDENNNILGIPPGNTQNFEGAGVGICRVWGLAYTGEITASAGDNAAEVALSDGCFDLSDNFITFNRDTPDGGQVQTTDGDTRVYTCPGDGIDDIIDFAHVNASNSNYQYVITDDQNVILALPGNSANLEGAGVGVCRVWGFAYSGHLTAEAGQHVFSTQFSDGCWAISSNFIEVNRAEPDGGTVVTNDGRTVVNVIAGDGYDDNIAFKVEDNSRSKFTFVITDDQNNILGVPPGNVQNFEGAGEGVCRVWGLSYTGNIIAGAGDNAATVALSDECFDLSDNYIEIIRTSPTPEANFTGGSARGITSNGLNVYPNPVIDQMEITISKSDAQHLNLIDISGKTLSAYSLQIEEGVVKQSLDVSQLQNGIYFIQLINADGTMEMEKFIKQSFR